mgnify:CR=1 FL=1
MGNRQNHVNDWENPLMIDRNKEPGHVPLALYANERAALAGEGGSEYMQSLNG